MERSSLETKFIFLITAAALFFSILAAFGQYYAEYSYEMKNIEENLLSLESSYLTAITASRFFLDDDQLNLLLRGILSRPDIDFVAVLDQNGSVLSSVAAMGTYRGKNTVQRTYPLIYTYQEEERTIGALFVEAGIEHVYRRLRNQIFFNIVSIIFITLFFAASIILLQQRFIIRHLKKINIYLESVTLTGSAYIPLSLDRGHHIFKHPDELDTIVGTVNGMLKRISDGYRQEQETQQQLSGAVEERETLLRELYHRTRNTMQIIMSMMIIEAAKMPENAQTQRLIKETERRIFSVSLVHELLYTSGNLTHISSGDFIKELVRHISGGVFENDETEMEIEEFPLLLDTAIPLGLILVELFGLSIQQKERETGAGSIRLVLTGESTEQGTLRYTDNSVRMESIKETSRSESTTTFSLIKAISKQQMNGRGDFVPGRELHWYMNFPLTLYKIRIST